ncbi:hypothetical protein [Rhizobium leguminosarum]|uniref:hypothetical protein n=1 Tax=Rhizobium leguminosarum TaxID=384 RepID=UPI0021BC0E15|nr:hypothetical protein [Rhizobium leguminosarum]
MLTVNDGYQELLDKDASAALRLTQSNRSLETARASISDMVMTRSKEARARAEAGLNDARENFVRFMDLAIAAVPEPGELPKLQADGFSVLTDTCGAAIAVGRGATSEAEIAMVQQLYLTLCQPAFAAISPRFTSITENSLRTQSKSVLTFQALSVTRPCGVWEQLLWHSSLSRASAFSQFAPGWSNQSSRWLRQ